MGEPIGEVASQFVATPRASLIGNANLTVALDGMALPAPPGLAGRLHMWGHSQVPANKRRDDQHAFQRAL